jgi:hypothetical protein
MFSFCDLLEDIIYESESQTSANRINNSWNSLLECTPLRQIKNSNSFEFVHESKVNDNLYMSINPFNGISQLLRVLSTLHFALYILHFAFYIQ